MILLEELLPINKITNIYVDLDEVLTDFDNQFAQLASNTQHLTPLEYETKYGKGSIWNIINPEGIPFWSDMKWMKGGKRLVQYLLPLKDKYNIQILSMPSIEQDSRTGKALWIERELHNVFPLNLSFTKSDYATPTSLLIDDYGKNTREWIAAGGIAIKHIDTNDTIKQLKKLGI